ncbi:MAG TPA: multiheme c-type cytochrome [Planctomycetaceae bacterium]|nr:multiheme c-type cytochrome [Planctomycetaceae bacterium]
MITAPGKGIHVAAGAFLAVTLALGGGTGRAQAQPAGESGFYGLPHASGRTFEGVGTSCVGCHFKAQERDSIPGVGGATDDGWALLNEVRTWGRVDKHYQAYAVLLMDRSKQMARIMGVVDPDTGESLIHRDQRCLACHSSLPLDQLNADERGLIPEELTADPRVDLGVSCEGCHGAAGDGGPGQDGWVTLHYNKRQWRFMPAEEKWLKYGYYDVRSPVSQARLCAACHVGNARTGRVVTHEMYAAGHPPLPGLETEIFVDQQPQHWRDFAAKKPEIQKEFLEQTGQDWKPEHLHHTRKLLVAALVNLSESLKLSADLADSSTKLPVARSEWPELAQFACFACHHELKTPAWRQERGYWLVPGRPVPHEWPLPLARLAAGLDPQAQREFAAGLADLRGPLNEQPFGTPRALPAAFRKVAAWADSRAEDLATRPITRDVGDRLLAEIARMATTETLDYDSSRQLVWAFSVVYRELNPTPYYTAVGFNPGTSIDASEIGWFPHRDSLDPVEQRLARLDDLLLLDLRKGRIQTQTLRGEDRRLLEADLKLVLDPIQDYEPSRFKQRFSEVVRALDERRTAAN